MLRAATLGSACVPAWPRHRAGEVLRWEPARVELSGNGRVENHHSKTEDLYVTGHVMVESLLPLAFSWVTDLDIFNSKVVTAVCSTRCCTVCNRQWAVSHGVLGFKFSVPLFWRLKLQLCCLNAWGLCWLAGITNLSSWSNTSALKHPSCTRCRWSTLFHSCSRSCKNSTTWNHGPVTMWRVSPV